MKYHKLIRILLIFCLLFSKIYAYGITDINIQTINQDTKVNLKESNSNNLNNEYINKIWDSVYADVNGDSYKEKIELVERQSENDSQFCSGNLKLNIRNSKTNAIIKTQLVFEDSGICPELMINDLNNDGAQDILISMYSGGTGYGYVYYALYTFKNNELKQIDLDNISNDDGYHIKFKSYDEDQLLLNFEGLENNFIVPLSRYQAALYKKIKNKEKFYDDLRFGYFPGSYFEILDYDGDGKNELKCSKIFAAEYKSDIAKLDIIYKYNDKDWRIVSAEVESINKKKSEFDKAKQINFNDLKFGKLMCGLNYNEVVKMLGKPLTESNFVGIDLEYKDGTSLYICPVVNNIKVTSSNYSTPRGLTVGDTKEKVIKLYGNPDETVIDDLSESWTYWTDDLDYLYIDFEEGKVKYMTIDCSSSLRD